MKHQGPVHGVLRPCRGLSAFPGFTVVELLIVLAILGILATIATPRLSRALAQNRARQAASLLKADLKRVAQLARSTSRPWTVTFVAASASYTVTGADAAGAEVAWTVTFSSDPYLASFSSVEFGTDNALVFSGHGLATESGRVRITSGTATCEVTVTPDQTEPTASLL